MQKPYYYFFSALFIKILIFCIPLMTLGQNTLIHFWYMDGSIPNNTPLTHLDATYSLTELTAEIEYHSALEGYPFDNEHPNWRKASMERRNKPTDINYRPVANNGLPYNVDDMRGLQVKQPFSGDGGENTMIFHLPTTGYKEVLFQFAAIDEGAAQALLIDYSVSEDTEWISDGLATTVFPLDEDYLLFSVNFSGNSTLEEANDNPHFKIRIRFQGEDMEADLGDRVTFNNISLDGVPLDDTNLPPFVINPVALQLLIEGDETTSHDLNQIFSDPDGDPLTFTASSNRSHLADASVSGSTLEINPVQRGDAIITLTASDGNNPEIYHAFRVMVYPTAHALADGDFVFNQWNNNSPEYTYPENMIFLQSDISDPGLDVELMYPYFIPHDDYHADDQETIGFPYNNTGRTRINGLGAGGVTFINTGRDRDLGGALVALNTMGQDHVNLSFLAGTMLQNSRIYAFRLQYRMGVSGSFNNLLIDGQPLEYIASADGDILNYNNIELPANLLNQEYIQLMWRYYHYSGDNGPRSMLRLDDIVITRPTNVENNLEDMFNVFTSGNNIHIENPFAETVNVTIYNMVGQLVSSKGIQGQGMHTLNSSLPAGIYIVTLQTQNRRMSKKIVIH